MRYLILGIAGGVILNFFVFLPAAGGSILPEFHGKVKKPERINVSPWSPSEGYFTLWNGEVFYKLNSQGKIVSRTSPGRKLSSFSGNGDYYIAYEKAGKEIEFFNDRGSRFWKLKSREYPYISETGELIFFLNGDHSRIRILNHNGNVEKSPVFSGRLCTVIVFSPSGDCGAGGFLDGSFFAVNERREVLYRGHTPGGNPVKGLAISPGGKFLLVHHGTTSSDSVMIIDVKRKKTADLQLNHVHRAKSELYIDEKGESLLLDYDRLIYCDKDGEIIFVSKIKEKREGHASLAAGKYFIAAGYTGIKGRGHVLVFNFEGRCLFKRVLPGESFIDLSVLKNSLLVRGSDNLYCYSLHFGDGE